MSLAKGDPLRDFKEQNPIICTKLEFSNIYDTHSQEEASKICWAVFMLEEPDQEANPYARTPRNERLVDIGRNYYVLDVKKYRTVIDAYSEWALDFEENMYKVQKDKLDELTAHFKELSLDDDDDFEKYLKISDRLGKIWANFDLVKKKLKEAKNTQTHALGGVTLSKAEERRNKRR